LSAATQAVAVACSVSVSHFWEPASGLKGGWMDVSANKAFWLAQIDTHWYHKLLLTHGALGLRQAVRLAVVLRVHDHVHILHAKGV